MGERQRWESQTQSSTDFGPQLMKSQWRSRLHPSLVSPETVKGAEAHFCLNGRCTLQLSPVTEVGDVVQRYGSPNQPATITREKTKLQTCEAIPTPTVPTLLQLTW